MRVPHALDEAGADADGAVRPRLVEAHQHRDRGHVALPLQEGRLQREHQRLVVDAR